VVGAAAGDGVADVVEAGLNHSRRWLQKCQYETQCRIIQLTAGKPAKQKRAVYERLDADNESSKLTYGLQIGTVFASVFPNGSSWPLFHQHRCDYLRRMSYLIGV